MEDSQIVRRGGKPQKTAGQTIKIDLKINHVCVYKVHVRKLWHCLIHVADLT